MYVYTNKNTHIIVCIYKHNFRQFLNLSIFVEDINRYRVESFYINRTYSEYHPSHGCITGDSSPSIPS